MLARSRRCGPPAAGRCWMKPVKLGLETTLELLTESANESAVAALLPALDSVHQTIQEGALRALLARRSTLAQQELVARWPTLNARWKAIIAERPARLTAALRDAILGPDGALCENACRAAQDLRDYDQVAVLLTAAEDPNNPRADLGAATLARLAELLYEELAAPRNYKERRDPQLIRVHVVAALEKSILRFERHRRQEVVEAFLLLAARDNAALQSVLRDPHQAVYPRVIDLLTRSPQPGIVRLLLSYLDDPNAPLAAIQILARRNDAVLVRQLLRKVGSEPAGAIRSNLRRIDHVAWLDNEPLLDSLDEYSQHALVRFITNTNMKRPAAFLALRRLLQRGATAGRRAAAAALAAYNGQEANQLVWDCLEDPDPQVRATLIGQLRERGIAGALGKLLALVDSPETLIRDTARRALSEFNTQRYLSVFESLDEENRLQTGRMVLKIDSRFLPTLAEELQSRGRIRRLRALSAITGAGVVVEMEAPLIARLEDDEDHLIRAEAAAALAACPTLRAIAALRAALNDSSVSVQHAAERSLSELAHFAPALEDSLVPDHIAPEPSPPPPAAIPAAGSSLDQWQPWREMSS